jgi:hypothetical protein
VETPLLYVANALSSCVWNDFSRTKGCVLAIDKMTLVGFEFHQSYEEKIQAQTTQLFQPACLLTRMPAGVISFRGSDIPVATGRVRNAHPTRFCWLFQSLSTPRRATPSNSSVTDATTL